MDRRYKTFRMNRETLLIICAAVECILIFFLVYYAQKKVKTGAWPVNKMRFIVAVWIAIPIMIAALTLSIS